MTKQLIEITFQNAIAQARRLESCADSMVTLANSNLPAVRGEVQAAWEGEEANAYLSKMETTGENILKTAARLYSAATTIRTVAKIFRESELRALEIATQRTF